MAVEKDDSKLPHAEATPAMAGSGHDDSVTRGDTTEHSTLAQNAPPAWVLSSGSASSNVSRSGKELYELEREIERGQAIGAVDLAEGYTLVNKLGTGSFGAVWEAENRLTHERVAIKFFTAGDADWARLLGEVGVLQTVEGCGGIVMVKEVRPGGVGRRPHYVMQLANSGSVADWLKSAKSMPPCERTRVAVAYFTRVARAMAAVHRRGIHHCDLKPHNILLHAPEPGAPPEPLVADFGQAHMANDDTPALGTFFYMPPDQIEAAQSGTPPDTRWDVYALGALMYEMLTGEAPRRSPELVERIKKSPKNLQTRMAVYREGLLAAPTPTAHRALADPMLAKIIDRCLSLRPQERPPDAGALVALLDGRSRWRRTRPVLGLAALATVLLVGIVTALGLMIADSVTERTKNNVSDEVTGSLARTAGYGARAIEDRMQRHIVSLDQWADRAHTNEPEAIAALKEASRMPRGAKLPGDTALTPEGHDAVIAWIKRLQKQRKQWLGPNEHVPSLGVMVVADDAVTGKPSSRGFYIARIHADDSVEQAEGAEREKDKGIFVTDMSYRDYFHAGARESSDVGKPHPVVRAAHISHPFRSRGTDRSGHGFERQRWKLNIVSPIWDNPQKRDRVIGLLVLGLDVEYDVKSLLYPTDFQRRNGSGSSYGIDQLVKVVVTDQRGRWIWHPDCEAVLDSDLPEFKHPHAYPELVRKHNFDGPRAGPWLSLDTPPTADNPHGYSESNVYVDPVETELSGESGPEIACFTRFNPYARSRYAEVDATGSTAPPRRWVFVAQVDKSKALRPLDDMKGEILRGGWIVVGALALIAAGLWIGLVVVLRRLEFAPHG